MDDRMDDSSRRVTLPSAGETLTGLLFTPQGPASGRVPAVVIAGGQTCVKEQLAGVYAERLAARGYAALAFDFRGFGESTSPAVRRPSASTTRPVRSTTSPSSCRPIRVR
jgi:dienelactone hydrolase